MNKLITRKAINKTAFHGDLVIRASPRWEIFNPENKTRQRKVQLYRVQEPFSFYSAKSGLITCPAGFMTDFGSVPGFAKWFVDDDDPDLLFASLPHDLLYSTKGQIEGREKMTRYQADCVLREAMRAAGAPELKIFVVFWAVRIGGRFNWNE